jgi:hypothetical protein
MFITDAAGNLTPNTGEIGEGFFENLFNLDSIGTGSTGTNNNTIDLGGGISITLAEGGGIEGPGTETSDDIPALLSDGEFVIKASAVKGLGRENGAKNDKEARQKGFDLLYKLQEQYGDLEEYAEGGEVFKSPFNAKSDFPAKDPTDGFGDLIAQRRLLERNKLRRRY